MLTMKLLVQTCSILFLMFSFTTSQPSPILNLQNLAKPGCNRQCGKLIVPYPFGIGTNCSMNVGFTIYCNTSTKYPRASFNEYGLPWIKSLSYDTVLLYNKVERVCYKDLNRSLISSKLVLSADFTKSPLVISKVNFVTLIGCKYFVWLTLSTTFEGTSLGCRTFCSKPIEVVPGKCSGTGCCQISMSKHVKQIDMYIGTFENSSEMGKIETFNPCGYSFIGDIKDFKFKGIDDFAKNSSLINRIEATVPIMFDWAIGNHNCNQVKKTHGFACHGNSSCVDSTNSGYRCICNVGYEGNPYLSPGCQDVNECEHLEVYPCYGKCLNIVGSYKCTCLQGSFGNAYKVNGCQHIDPSDVSFNIYIIIVMAFVILALACGVGRCWVIKRRKLAGLREKFFLANGGLLLKQKMNSQGCHDAITVFSQQQLVKATNNYSHERIIGKGAYGVVYKGVLCNKCVVAVKCSKLVDATQVEQFINEVFILTQVIHRFVVKLLGCCLEVEVPILVYEYIPNNTLFYHIHHTPGGMIWLSWEHRLRIAAEVASALAYLHSETSIPIIHRDIKSSNILLDTNFTAKVSDFGASRLAPLDHDHVTTLVQGTLGYLDPEYFQTGQLTQKSDVYSFGVVLAELITNKKNIDVDRENKNKYLATYFVISLKENRLNTIVEPRIWNEGCLEQWLAIGDLVKRCLNLEADCRPTMKEVLYELDVLRKLTPCNNT